MSIIMTARYIMGFRQSCTSWPLLKLGIRRGTVAFSSQPDLEPDDPRQSLADLYKLHRRRETEGPNRLGVFQRLFSLFGSRPSSRKTSTASFTGKQMSKNKRVKTFQRARGNLVDTINYVYNNVGSKEIFSWERIFIKARIKNYEKNSK